jgi:uncharacterized protein YegJ (DUF2314 family)
MRRFFISILPLAIVGAFLMAGCSQESASPQHAQVKRDETEKNDPDMLAAFAKGKETLPVFWEAFDKHAPGEEKFAIKVKMQDTNGIEYLWVGELEKKDGKLSGAIRNPPDTVKHVKFAQRVDVIENDIVDWMYFRDGKIVGNHTLRALFKFKKPDELAKLKAMFAEP